MVKRGLVLVVLFAAACGKSGLDDLGDASADAGTFTPPAKCGLPFDPGPCEAAIRVYASVNGKCVEKTWGGCQGNDNRFVSLEDCLLTCEGRGP